MLQAANGTLQVKGRAKGIPQLVKCWGPHRKARHGGVYLRPQQQEEKDEGRL